MENIKKVLDFLKGWGAIVIAALAVYYARAANKAAEASDRMLADNVVAKLRQIKGMENTTIKGEYHSPNIVDMIAAPFRMLFGLAGSDPKTATIVVMSLAIAGYLLWEKIIKPWHKKDAARSTLSNQREGNRPRGGTQNDRRQPGDLPRVAEQPPHRNRRSTQPAAPQSGDHR